MYHKISQLGLSVAAALCVAALRASAADDVTIQVLDDVKETAKVLADVDHSLHADANARPAKPDTVSSHEPRLVGQPPASESGPRPSYFGTIIDREEESEGEIEDFDVPQDVVVPPASGG